MGMQAKLLKCLNKLFPSPLHPFNLSNEGKTTYPKWQFERGNETIKFYLRKMSIEEMFKDKIVLDIGCGAAGKTVFYASQGVLKIYGLEILEKYRNEAYELARDKGLDNKFEFVVADAASTGFDENTFDTIIMNDAMEHVDKPEDVLRECYRILKPGGRLFINFPPYFHPFGAHLSDAISIPWVHIFFAEKTLIDVYKEMVMKLPDGEERVNFRIDSRDNGMEYFSYINKMTIKRYKSIIKGTNLNFIYYKDEPLRSGLGLISKFPLLKEFTVKMVVSIFEK